MEATGGAARGEVLSSPRRVQAGERGIEKEPHGRAVAVARCLQQELLIAAAAEAHGGWWQRVGLQLQPASGGSPARGIRVGVHSPHTPQLAVRLRPPSLASRLLSEQQHQDQMRGRCVSAQVCVVCVTEISYLPSSRGRTEGREQRGWKMMMNAGTVRW